MPVESPVSPAEVNTQTVTGFYTPSPVFEDWSWWSGFSPPPWVLHGGGGHLSTDLVNFGFVGWLAPPPLLLARQGPLVRTGLRAWGLNLQL